jgi:glycerol-3-phosphate dehydrogenase (NAD(P)+)
VICAKGIEKDSGKLVTEVAAESLPGAALAILSGPSFARDVARGLPTAVTIAAKGELAPAASRAGFAAFRPYASDDLIGVALGGAAKNVYAIACGVVEGMGLGENARAALLARSFAELTRLGEHLGARRETLMGLSGLGDLVLTATSPSSRNFSFGIELGRGKSLAELNAPGSAGGRRRHRARRWSSARGRAAWRCPSPKRWPTCSAAHCPWASRSCG